jgi:hypothetical protein
MGNACRYYRSPHGASVRRCWMLLLSSLSAHSRRAFDEVLLLVLNVDISRRNTKLLISDQWDGLKKVTDGKWTNGCQV